MPSLHWSSLSGAGFPSEIRVKSKSSNQSRSSCVQNNIRTNYSQKSSQYFSITFTDNQTDLQSNSSAAGWATQSWSHHPHPSVPKKPTHPGREHQAPPALQVWLGSVWTACHAPESQCHLSEYCSAPDRPEEPDSEITQSDNKILCKE